MQLLSDIGGEILKRLIALKYCLEMDVFGKADADQSVPVIIGRVGISDANTAVSS